MAGFLTKEHATVQIVDGVGASLTVSDVGDFTFDGLQHNEAPAVAIMHRKRFVAYVHGDQAAHSFSFSGTVKSNELRNASSKTIFDAVLKTGAWSAATTTNPGGDGPMTYTIVYATTLGGVASTVNLTNAYLTASINESGDAIVISVSGTAYGLTATGV